RRRVRQPLEVLVVFHASPLANSDGSVSRKRLARKSLGQHFSNLWNVHIHVPLQTTSGSMGTSNVCGSSIIHGPRDRLKNNIGTRLVFSASRTHCCHHPHTGEGRPSSTFFSAHASRHFTSTLKGNRELVVSRSPATSNSPEACQPPLSGVRTNDASGSKRRHHAVSKSRTWYSPRLPLE